MQPLFAEHPAVDLALLVAPVAGRFRRVAAPVQVIARGSALGHVVGNGCRDAVSSPVDAVVDRVLVRDGDTVQPGQVLAWGRPCRLESLT